MSNHGLRGSSMALADEIAGALRAIELESIDRLAHKTKWRRWRYDELAALAGIEADWEYPGRFRVAIAGGDARTWIRSRFRLWWTGDDVRRAGLLFTADPRTGLSWDRNRIATRSLRDAAYLSDTAIAAAEMQPLFRPIYLTVARVSGQMLNAAQKLTTIGGLYGEG